MSVAVQAIMEGMPEPGDLHMLVHDGHTVLMVGNRAVAAYDNDDTGMRNMAVVTLTRLGFAGRRVAAVVGLTPEYVSQLRGQAARAGSAGLLRRRGRPAKLSAGQVRRARAWKADGLRDAEIARRLSVSHKTAARVVADVNVNVDADAGVGQAELDLSAAAATDAAAPQPTGGEPETATSGADVGCAGGLVPGGSARIGVGRFTSRYAGAGLLHAFTDRVGAADVYAQAIAAAARPGLRFDDLAVLTATSVAFGLGFACLEQAKHPDRAQVGPVAGIDVLPELRTLRPRLAAIADGTDPLALQRAFAAAMLSADPCTSGVYFLDEHFMPYSGMLPVGKGWNTKRRHAQPGRVDTTICDARGRAVCFTTGEPAGLSTSLPATLAELRAITGPDAKIMLGFDRGGSYPSVFTACRDARVDWITYRRGKPTTGTGLPIQQRLTRGRQKPITVVYTDETIAINDYGPARQITLFERGKPVLQILTSDTDSCAGALIWFIRARWRIENLFKYLDFYGIDYLADYTATITANTRSVDNPARKATRARLKALQAERDQLRERIGAVHTDRNLSIATLNRESVTAQRKIQNLERKITAVADELKTIPAKLPANIIDPDAKRAVHRANRRGLQMVLRLLVANAEHWLANRLNAYLQDPDEYRAVTRNLLHLGGTITYTTANVHIKLDRPATSRLARALALLLDEINTTPPHIPGDPRPIIYTLTE